MIKLNNGYISFKVDNNGKLKLRIKTKKDRRTSIIIEEEIPEENIDKIIKKLVQLKSDIINFNRK